MFVGVLSVQVLLGVALYGLSPLVRLGLSDLGSAMAVKELRFFAVEHITGMMTALVFIHVGSKRVRRAVDDRDKLRHTLIWQTLTTVAILVSIPWWRPLVRG